MFTLLNDYQLILIIIILHGYTPLLFPLCFLRCSLLLGLKKEGTCSAPFRPEDVAVSPRWTSGNLISLQSVKEGGEETFK